VTDLHSTLQRLLVPLLDHLEHDDITELVINEPGVAFVEQAGSWASLQDDVFSASKMKPIIKALNSHSRGNLDDSNTSLLSTTLPSGERIQVVTSPSVREFAIAIRKPGTIQLTLDDYDEKGAFDSLHDPETGDRGQDTLAMLLKSGDTKEFVRQAVIARKTIVISGGTSTGKTTFFNALVQHIPTSERLITIEDSREINLPHENKLHLIAQRKADASVFLDLLEACLRLRPDRILAAELRGAEAFTFLRTVNTGHPGSMTTIHANNTRAAKSQLSLMVAQAQLGLDQDLIADYIDKSVDVFIQLSRNEHGNRVVSEIEYNGHLYGGNE